MNVCYRQGSYMLHRCFNICQIHTVSVSLVLNRSLAIEHCECGNGIEVHTQKFVSHHMYMCTSNKMGLEIKATPSPARAPD